MASFQIARVLGHSYRHRHEKGVGSIACEPTASLGASWNNSTRSRELVLVASGSYLERMRAVGLKVLKNKLSEYVRLAASGETVLITDRDRVVAELVPPAVTRELHILSVGSKKLDRSQMQSVE